MSDRDQIIAVPDEPDDLDHNLSAILGLDLATPEGKPSRRTQNIGLVIALPIALILLALTVGVYRMQGWLPAQEAHPQAAPSNAALAQLEPAKPYAAAPVAAPEPKRVIEAASSKPAAPVPVEAKHVEPHHARTQLADRRNYTKRTEVRSVYQPASDNGRQEAIDAIREMRLR